MSASVRSSFGLFVMEAISASIARSGVVERSRGSQRLTTEIATILTSVLTTWIAHGRDDPRGFFSLDYVSDARSSSRDEAVESCGQARRRNSQRVGTHASESYRHSRTCSGAADSVW